MDVILKVLTKKYLHDLATEEAIGYEHILMANDYKLNPIITYSDDGKELVFDKDGDSKEMPVTAFHLLSGACFFVDMNMHQFAIFRKAINEFYNQGPETPLAKYNFPKNEFISVN